MITQKVSSDGIMSAVEKRAGADEEIKEEQRFSSAIIDSLGAMLLVLDLKGGIVRINRAFEELTGYTSDKVLGRDIWELLAPEEVDHVRDAFQNVCSGRGPSIHENLILAKNGDRRLISCNLSFIKVNEYLSWLIAHKFLKQDGNTYEATPAGRSFLVKLSHVKKL